MGGAVAGGLAGGAVGGFGRGMLDTRLLAGKPLTDMQAAGGTLRRMGTGLTNFAKRQVHGVTGHFDPNEIGMAGNRTSATRVELLNKRKAHELSRAAPKAHAGIEEQYGKEIAGELKSGRESQRLQDAGVQSLHGIGKALATPGRRGEAFKAMGRSLVYGSGGPTMALAAPALMYGPSLARGDETDIGGQSVGQKVRGLGFNLASGAALGGLPIMTQMVAGTGIDAAARRLGSLRRRPTPTPLLPEQAGETK